MLETQGDSLNEKTQMKLHTNHYKSLHSLKAGFVNYAWNFSLNIMHLKYIIKSEKIVVLNMEQRLFYSTACHYLLEIKRNYTRSYHGKLLFKTLHDCCVGLFFETIFVKMKLATLRGMWFTHKAINNSENTECR